MENKYKHIRFNPSSKYISMHSGRNTAFKLFFLISFSIFFSSCDFILTLAETPGNPDLPQNPVVNNNTDAKTEFGNFLPTQVLSNKIVEHKYYTLAYSSKNKNPEWAIYELTSSRVAKDVAERRSNFIPNPLLPEGTANNVEFNNSGYDRGHLVPAEDMNFSETAMAETFYVTNISPQDPDFNRGIWKKLENNVRKWATENKKIIVVTGPILRKRLDNKYTIGEGIEIPRGFYKIILDYSDPERKAIAFLLPNEKSDKPLSSFACTVRKVEDLTGINFFPGFSAKESEALENRFDINKWNLE